MSGSGWEAVLDVRKASPDVASGRHALQDVREWKGGFPG